MGARRRCCCECPLFTDDFSRPEDWDPDYVGPDYEEVVGDWDIDMENARLTEVGTADAILQCTYSMRDERMTCSFMTKDEAEGNIYRAIVNYLDADNYMYAELGIGSWSSGAYIAFHEVSSGTDTSLESFDLVLTGDTRIFTACIAKDIFSANLSTQGADFCVWTDHGWAHEDGHFAGIGNGAAQEIFVDNFACLAHYDYNRKCDHCCPCYCVGGDGVLYPSMTLTATYTGEDVCTTLNGISVTLESPRVDYYWEGTITGGDPDTCWGDLEGLKLTLLCNEDPEDVTTWRLKFDPSGMTDPTKYCWNDTVYHYSTADSVCDPFDIVFEFGPRDNGGPAICPDDCLDCGEAGPAMPPYPSQTHYWIHVTE